MSDTNIDLKTLVNAPNNPEATRDELKKFVRIINDLAYEHGNSTDLGINMLDAIGDAYATLRHAFNDGNTESALIKGYKLDVTQHPAEYISTEAYVEVSRTSTNEMKEAMQEAAHEYDVFYPPQPPLTHAVLMRTDCK